MPAIEGTEDSVQFILGGRLLLGAGAITRTAPGIIGGGIGGEIEVVTAEEAVELLFFVVP